MPSPLRTGILSLLLLSGVAVCTSTPTLAAEQTAEFWAERWRSDQEEAMIAIGRIAVEEETRYELEGAFGERTIRVQSLIVLGPAGSGDSEILRARNLSREVLSFVVGGRDRQGRGSERRRRFQSPVRPDLMDGADALLFPLAAFGQLQISGELDVDRVGGREIIRLITRARTDEAAIERVTWLFDRASGRLLRTRAVVRGRERGTIRVDTRYVRQDGLDLPVSRSLNGSFASRRRTRTYTVLLDARTTYSVNAVEGL